MCARRLDVAGGRAVTPTSPACVCCYSPWRAQRSHRAHRRRSKPPPSRAPAPNRCRRVRSEKDRRGLALFPNPTSTARRPPTASGSTYGSRTTAPAAATDATRHPLPAPSPSRPMPNAGRGPRRSCPPPEVRPPRPAFAGSATSLRRSSASMVGVFAQWRPASSRVHHDRGRRTRRLPAATQARTTSAAGEPRSVASRAPLL